MIRASSGARSCARVEQLHGLAHDLEPSAPHEEATAQEQILGLGVRGACPRLLAELGGERARDRLRRVVGNREHVRGGAIEAASPELEAVLDRDEPERRAHGLAEPTKRSVDDDVGAERSPDLADVALGVVEAGRIAPRPDEQPRHDAQEVDDVLVHVVDEVRIVARAEVEHREDRDDARPGGSLLSQRRKGREQRKRPRRCGARDRGARSSAR